MGEDKLYELTKQLVGLHRMISTILIQRMMKVGYARATRMIEMLETEGIVGSRDQNGFRKVLKRRTDE